MKDKPPIPPKDYIDAVGFPKAVELVPIGVVRSSYRERHGTPRQSSVGEPAQAQIELFEAQVPARALMSIEGFDYLWVIAWLHLNKHWNPTVVPPRGPRQRRGVLA
ncbi:MAG: TrmO family methyltransferase, partial [Myxococcota bacterium]